SACDQPCADDALPNGNGVVLIVDRERVVHRVVIVELYGHIDRDLWKENPLDRELLSRAVRLSLNVLDQRGNRRGRGGFSHGGRDQVDGEQNERNEDRKSEHARTL